MEKACTKRDIQILSEIAEKRIITPKQISLLCDRSAQTTRRRLRFLSSHHLIFSRERVFRNKPGRKGLIVTITAKGLEILKQKKILSTCASYITETTPNTLSVEHELMVNYVQISLSRMENHSKQFKVLFLTTSSHNLRYGSPDNPFIKEKFTKPGNSDEFYTLIPDGVFTITDKKSGKSILFFLEVDMGTETIVSPSNKSGDLFQKIKKYQSLFKHGNYSKYDEVANYKLKGFRVLFVTNTTNRMKSVCRLVESMPPSDFIWVTNKGELFRKGIAAKIWVRGGIYSKKSESILSEKYALNTPLLKSKN